MTSLFKLSKRHGFDLSQERKFTCNMGKLIPIMYEEVYPGDDFKVRTNQVIRLQPMTAPVMHRVDVYTYYFFVPFRLLWKDWENFITGGKYGNDSPNKDGSNPYVIPYVNITSPSKRSLAAYFGMPCVQNYTDQTTYDPGTYSVNAFPFRAMAKIWNDWFMDEFLDEEIEFSEDGGLDATINTTTLYSKSWQKDRFTNARISEQLGNPVYLPIGLDAPVSVYGDGKGIKLLRKTTSDVMGDVTMSAWTDRDYSNGARIGSLGLGEMSNDNVGTTVGTIADVQEGSIIGLSRSTVYGASGIIGTANLQTATGVAVSQVKTAFRVQQFMTEQARGGYRYVEHILTHFGVHSPDGRLQRAEFLGGGRSPITVSEVLQTSETSSTPQGNMSGHGINVNSNHAFTKAFNEYGCIIGLMCILPRTSYQQGIDRQFLRENKYDYLTPLLAPINQQAVLYKELYTTGVASDDNAIWGYQDQYDELRHRQNIVAGDMVDNMNDWHFGRIFASRPTYNASFVKADPSKRMFAVTDDTEDCCIVDLLNRVHAVRPLPKRGDTAII